MTEQAAKPLRPLAKRGTMDFFFFFFRSGIGDWIWLNHPENYMKTGGFQQEFFSLLIETHQHICYALPVERYMVGKIAHMTCQSQGADTSELNNSYTSLENKVWRRSEEGLPTECAHGNACSLGRLSRVPGKCEQISIQYTSWAPRLSLHKANLSCQFCAVKNLPQLVKWPTFFEIRLMPNFI